jgi:hypothetical protein
MKKQPIAAFQCFKFFTDSLYTITVEEIESIILYFGLWTVFDCRLNHVNSVLTIIHADFHEASALVFSDEVI